MSRESTGRAIAKFFTYSDKQHMGNELARMIDSVTDVEPFLKELIKVFHPLSIAIIRAFSALKLKYRM